MTFPESIRPMPIAGSRVKVAFAPGVLRELGNIVRDEGGVRVLLVSDPGITAAGHVERAVRALYKSGLVIGVFDEAAENPTTEHVNKGLTVARRFKPDIIVGLGGGSAMDCGKGINFLLTNGGRMQDYWGTDKAAEPMLPFVAVPTTAGTGSDAQSFALITDPETHQKMACGDRKALPRVAVLDPELTATTPPKVAAATGIDAVAHAIETAGTKRSNETSRKFSLEAWRLLEGAYERVMRDPSDLEARKRMLLGAHLGGAAIENSMLGAAHACANALTAACGTVHGIAVGLMLPHVIRFNAAPGENPYSDVASDAQALADRVEQMLEAGQLPRRLGEIGATEQMIADLAAVASTQWTAAFNPRPVQQSEFEQIFGMAL